MPEILINNSYYGPILFLVNFQNYKASKHEYIPCDYIPHDFYF